LKVYQKTGMFNEINQTILTLKSGGIILYPTDTIWGIGCDATNEKAVQKIFQIKERAETKAMIVLLDNENKLSRYLKDVPPLCYDLMEFSEKPLTIIYPNAVGLAKNLIAQDGSIAIRIVKDEFCKNLIYKFGKPIVSTSANISGEPSPASFSQINKTIINQMDFVVNCRQNEIINNKPSSIIKLGMKGEIEIIRK